MQDFRPPENVENSGTGTHGHTPEKVRPFRSLTNSHLHAPDLHRLPDGEGLLNLSGGFWHQSIYEVAIANGTVRCTVNADGDLVVVSIDGARIDVAVKSAEVSP